ncbi:MAG: hypothetical protein HY243_13600 [Proteobacteria bacterium]|nr:hypothetical protein [Pseudomonadota bacterium]
MQMWIRPISPVRLSRARRWVTYGIGLGLWLTGVAWLVLHYFLQQQGEFGPAPHPLEYWSRAAHGLFGFAALWTFGLLWGAHIVGAWGTRRHRISGTMLLGLLVWLIASGYLLYYLGNDAAISAVALAHWAVGLTLPLPFFAHRIAPLIVRKRTPQRDEDEGVTEGLV